MSIADSIWFGRDDISTGKCPDRWHLGANMHQNMADCRRICSPRTMKHGAVREPCLYKNKKSKGAYIYMCVSNMRPWYGITMHKISKSLIWLSYPSGIDIDIRRQIFRASADATPAQFIDPLLDTFNEVIDAYRDSLSPRSVAQTCLPIIRWRGSEHRWELAR